MLPRNCLSFIAAASADTRRLNSCRMEAGIRGEMAGGMLSAVFE